MHANVADTSRLRLRRFTTDDGAFVLELLNDPGWIRYIGDKGVRTRDDAQRYLEKGPMAMYERLGFGLYLVELKATGEPIGMCGLIQRPALDDVDLGFAFLPRFRGSGYAQEAASAVMSHARQLSMTRIVAILTDDNERSARLLDKLGFRFERIVHMPPDGEALHLYATGI
jgi:RimJ/RimL family protein N-acetyltransferase